MEICKNENNNDFSWVNIRHHNNLEKEEKEIFLVCTIKLTGARNWNRKRKRKEKSKEQVERKEIHTILSLYSKLSPLAGLCRAAHERSKQDEYSKYHICCVLRKTILSAKLSWSWSLFWEKQFYRKKLVFVLRKTMLPNEMRPSNENYLAKWMWCALGRSN